MDVPAPQHNWRHFGPTVRLDGWDGASPEVAHQAPLEGQLYRVLPGPDRPDYSIVLLRSPLLSYAPAEDHGAIDAAEHPVPPTDLARLPRVPDRRGRPMVRFDALVVCSRFVGEQLHRGMRGLAVHVAGVADPGLLGAAAFDPARCSVLGAARLTELSA